MTFQFPDIAIKRTKERLYGFGQRIPQKTWQSVISPDDTWEILNHNVSFHLPNNHGELRLYVKPNIPWADDHFMERIGGEPLNPPPSHVFWPFSVQGNKEHVDGLGGFSHTYPERFWPKKANRTTPNFGIRYYYGDFQDVINLLIKDPSTRQAYLPIWFPEDTGAVVGQRVPCSLGYHFIIRNGYLHLNYYIRSCDYIRHFRDDIYMACRLVYYVIDQLDLASDITYHPGGFNMYITSLHCFYKERELLLKDKY